MMQSLVNILAVLLLMLFSTRFGGIFTLPPSNISAFWPANALLFSALLLMPESRSRRMTLLLALPACLVAELWIGYPPMNAIIYSIANVTEVALMLWLMQKAAIPSLTFDDLKQFFTLLFISIPASIVGGSIGAAGVVLAGGAYGEVFIRWSLADYFGYCLIVPLFLTAGQWPQFFRQETASRKAELVLLLALLVLVCMLSFGGHVFDLHAPSGSQFLPMPILLWAALRFGPTSGALATVIVTCFAFFSATHGVGMFSAGEGAENVASLQLFFASVVTSVMTIACLSAERKKTIDLLQAEIDERTQAEEALRLSENELRRQGELQRAILDDAAYSVISASPEGIITSFNHAAERLLGYTASEVVGIKTPEIWHDADEVAQHAEALTAELGESIAPGFDVFTARPRRNMSEEREWTFIRKDGTRLRVMLSVTALHDETGGITGYVGIIYDLTERKEAEKVLMQYAAIVESTEDAIVSETLDGIVTSWNNGAERMFGYRADEIVGHPITRLIPEDRQGDEQEILAQIERGEPIRHYETVRRCKNGSLIEVSVTVSPLRDSKGTVIGASKIARNITEKKKTEKELRLYREHLEDLVSERTVLLEAANQELESFSYSVSHDLRTPLRAIDGFSRLLETKYGDRLDSEAQRLIRVVRDSAVRMAQLIDDILAFSRSGRVEFHLITVDMRELIDAAWMDLETARLGRQIEFTVQPLPTVMGDPIMLRQVWLNLLSNAVKFTSQRSVAHIEIGCTESAESYTYSIRDDGVGFDPNYAQKLFGVFQRLHAVDEFEGTGIGLAIVKRIVSRHGGTVSAEGKVGEGAVFRFTLPK